MTELNSGDRHVLMEVAYQIAQSSTCVSRQVGAVISIAPNVLVASTNQSPRNTKPCERKECRCFDPNRESGKDLHRVYAIHAEAAAICHAARKGEKTEGATMIVTDLPCNDCAKLIIDAGIKRVIYDRDYPDSRSPEMFAEAGVVLEQFSMEAVS